jgi:hypothetical protein
MKKIKFISLVSLVVLSLTGCNTKTSFSTDFLISSGKFCGVYYNTQKMCLEFSSNELTLYNRKKKTIVSVKYEKANDSIIYYYPLNGDNGGEIYLKSKDSIIVDGNLELSINGYTSPE